MSRWNVFVDESKAREYLLVAAVLGTGDMVPARRSVQSRMLPGQSRLHMKKESDARRRQHLAAFVDLGLETRIYRAVGGPNELDRRRRCLESLVEDLAALEEVRVCLETDQTLMSRDRQWLTDARRRAACTGSLSYHHQTAVAEPLPAIPDAFAWAWAKGGEWRRRCGTIAVGDLPE